MDQANDDDFGTSWISNPAVDKPWYEIDFTSDRAFNAISIAEEKANITKYKLEYYENSTWKPLFDGENGKRVKIHRFNQVYGSKVRIWIEKSDHQPSIAEFGVYDEQR